MKFAICNETFLDWTHDEAFEFARRSGYTGIEIAPFTLNPDARKITEQQRNEVRSAADAAGLEVVGLHWLLAKTEGFYLTSPEREVRQRTGAYLEHLAHLCRDLGGSIMVFGSPQQRNLLPGVTMDQAMEYAADVFRQCMPTIERLDVTLAVEPLGPAEGNFLNTARDAAQLIERVASPHCRLLLDCKAMSSEEEPPADIVRQFSPLLAHFHANDPNRLGPGFGELDFHPILAALGEVDYRGWVSVEVFDYTPGVERLARESIEYMQSCLKELASS